VLQLPLPPADLTDLNEIVAQSGVHEQANEFALAMDVCSRWYDGCTAGAGEGKALREMNNRQVQPRIDRLACRLVACPPLFLAQV